MRLAPRPWALGAGLGSGAEAAKDVCGALATLVRGRGGVLQERERGGELLLPARETPRACARHALEVPPRLCVLYIGQEAVHDPASTCAVSTGPPYPLLPSARSDDREEATECRAQARTDDGRAQPCKMPLVLGNVLSGPRPREHLKI